MSAFKSIPTLRPICATNSVLITYYDSLRFSTDDGHPQKASKACCLSGVSLYCNSVSLDPPILCNYFYIWTSTVYLFAVHSALKADGQTLKGLPNTWMTVSICVLY